MKLNKEDSVKFLNQVKYGRPSKTARAALKNGLKLLKELRSKGYATIPKEAS